MNERAVVRASSNTNDKVLRKQGVVRRVVDPSGSCDRSPVRGDWLEELVLSSAPAQSALDDALAAIGRGDEVQPVRVCPGIWLIASSNRSTRHRQRESIAMVLTREILDGEHLNMLCHAGRLDRTLTASLLAGLDLCESADIRRTADLLSLLSTTEGEVARRTVMLEEIGRQLGETYEEVHLFHTLIGETSVAASPKVFLSMVLEELLRILPFSWIGTRIDMNRLNLPEEFSGFLVDGEHDDQPHSLRALGDRLMATVEGREPMVLDAREDPRFDGMNGCGSSMIVCPIAGDDGTIGVIYAGKKQGSDEAASSIETKLIGAAAEHVSVFLRNASLYENLDAMFLGTVQGMVSAIDAKDPYTCGHSQRVSWLAGELAATFGLSDAEVRRVQLAGLVHDVGKIGVPESVLCKSGRLTDSEFDLIKQHPGIGARILKDIPQMQDIIPAVLHHHERWDGAGYPDGISREEIPLSARFVAIADTFDAMSSNRTYRSARSRDFVRAEVLRCSGSQFDPQLVEPFLSMGMEQFDDMIQDHRALHQHDRKAA